jgi:hypothetical protein
MTLKHNTVARLKTRRVENSYTLTPLSFISIAADGQMSLSSNVRVFRGAMFLLFLAAPSFGRAEESSLKREGNLLRFSGEISLDSAKALVDRLSPGIETLVVTSMGGDARAGQIIAREVIQRKIKVIVDKYCLSSCANYIFLAAASKTLAPGAIIGFHGGLVGEPAPAALPDGTAVSQEVAVQFKELYRVEKKLFFDLKVDPELIRLSYALTKPEKKTIHYAVMDKLGNTRIFTEDDAAQLQRHVDSLLASNIFDSIDVRLQNTSERKFYFPRRETLLKFGVRNVDEYPYPATAQEMRKLGESILPGLELVGDYASAQ